MHLPVLTRTAGTQAASTPWRTAWTVLAVTGWWMTLPMLGLALVVTAAFPDGRIDHVGPMPLYPEVRLLTIVPLLLAVAVAIAHSGAGTPVVFVNRRVRAARLLSYATTMVLALAIVLLGGAVGTDPAVAASLRTLLLMTGICVLTAALVGVVYAFVPAVLAFAAAVLSSPGPGDWTVWGLLLRDTASASQLVVATLVGLVGIGVAVADPRSPDYLRRASTRRP